MTIWPDAPAEAILNAQFHDVGEVGTGDLPYPVKSRNPSIKREMDRLESETRAAMGVGVHMNCSQEWRDRVKLCDCIEMWEFGKDEVHLGNHFAELVVTRMADMIASLAPMLDTEEWLRMTMYLEERRARYL